MNDSHDIKEITILDQGLWDWAKTRAKVLGCKTVSEYIFHLIRIDKERVE